MTPTQQNNYRFRFLTERCNSMQLRIKHLEKQMNTQEKTLADAITPLLAQITVFADKFDALAATVTTTGETAQSAQAEIDATLQAILQRGGAMPGADLADLVNQVSQISKRVTGEIAMAGTAADEINQHSQQLKAFADDVQSKADAPSTDTPVEGTPGATITAEGTTAATPAEASVTPQLIGATADGGTGDGGTGDKSAQ
jgi:uncharacterized coiled-coil protein SlyX